MREDGVGLLGELVDEALEVLHELERGALPCLGVPLEPRLQLADLLGQRLAQVAEAEVGTARGVEGEAVPPQVDAVPVTIEGVPGRQGVELHLADPGAVGEKAGDQPVLVDRDEVGVRLQERGVEREVVQQVELHLLEQVLLLLQDGPDALLLGRARLVGREVREVRGHDQPAPGEEELEVKVLPHLLLEVIENEGGHLEGVPLDESAERLHVAPPRVAARAPDRGYAPSRPGVNPEGWR